MGQNPFTIQSKITTIAAWKEIASTNLFHLRFMPSLKIPDADFTEAL